LLRVALAVSGGIVAAIAVAVIEGSVGAPTLIELLVMMGVIALILLLTGWRRPRNAGDSADLRPQLEHHRRELYRLQARYQRKGVLTAAEISAWFRNKRTLASLRKQLQDTGTPYPPDAIDTAPPPTPLSLFTRTREFFRQPAVSLFIVLFLVSLALAYPLAAAAQFVFRDYLATAGPFTQSEEPDSVPVAGVTATNTPQPATHTPTQVPTETELASSSTLTSTTTVTTTPTTQPATATAAAVASATSTHTRAPTATTTATATETPAAATATTQPTSQPTSTPSPTGTPLPTLPPPPTATSSPTPTFLPVGTLPPECGEGAGEAEPNNTFEMAQGPLAPGATTCGYLDDVYDFYYVEVATPGRLTVTLQNVEMEPGTPPLNLLKLFTAGTAPMDWCCISRQERIELAVEVNFGRYYILVDTREIVGLPYVLTVGYEAAG